MAKAKKKSGLDSLVILITCVLMLAGTVGLIFGSVWLYIVSNPENIPESHATTYVSTITDQDGEERYFIEIEYWDNSDGNGKEVVEITFNAYTGIEHNHVTQKVVQFSRKDASADEVDSMLGMTDLYEFLMTTNQKMETWDAYYYDKDDASTWRSIERIDNTTPMYVTIGDTLYSVTMDGKYTIYNEQFNFFKSVANAFKGLAGSVNYQDRNTWYNYLPEEKTYTMNEFYAALVNNLVVNDAGYGTNVLSLVDLSKYFSIKNAETGQFIDVELNQEYAKQYFSVLVTRHHEGMTRSSESNVGIYKDDASWSLHGADDVTKDYYDYTIPIYLDENDFEYRYCEDLGGYIAVLKEKYNSSAYKRAVFSASIDVEVFGEDFLLVGILHDVDHNYVTIAISRDEFSYHQEVFYEILVGDIESKHYTNVSYFYDRMEVLRYER